jgi:hypothetical protein
MTLPAVTPEMVAALTNLIIEARATMDAETLAAPGQSAWMDAFRQAAEVDFDETNARHHLLLNASLELGARLDYPAPYLCEVKDQQGTLIGAANRTLSYFYETEGFTQSDCAAVAALDPGASYVVYGAHASMTVLRAA